MNGRAIVSFLVGLLVVGILVGVGVGIYNAGIAQGVVEAGRIPAGAVVPVAGYVALCGAKPGRRSAGWSDHDEPAATCPRCIRVKIQQAVAAVREAV